MRRRGPEPHTLAGAYALDALTGADRARFERHLARCEQCAQEIGELREVAARLAAAGAAEPPPGLTERALAAAAQTRQLPPVTRETAMPWTAHAAAARPGGASGLPRRAWMPELALALAGAFLVIAAALGLAAHTARHQLAVDQVRSHAISAILTARDADMISERVAGGGTATVVMSRREHALVFAAAGLRTLPGSRCYELWLMSPGADKPAGMLPYPRQGMTGPVLASGIRPGERLGLTVEPAGGSPHPTTAVILVVAM
jgi:anti-sigma-K factor RskA